MEGSTEPSDTQKQKPARHIHCQTSVSQIKASRGLCIRSGKKVLTSSGSAVTRIPEHARGDSSTYHTFLQFSPPFSPPQRAASSPTSPRCSLRAEPAAGLRRRPGAPRDACRPPGRAVPSAYLGHPAEQWGHPPGRQAPRAPAASPSACRLPFMRPSRPPEALPAAAPAREELGKAGPARERKRRGGKEGPGWAGGRVPPPPRSASSG